MMGYCYYPHFTDEGTEAQSVPGLKSHSWESGGAGIGTGCPRACEADHDARYHVACCFGGRFFLFEIHNEHLSMSAHIFSF